MQQTVPETGQRVWKKRMEHFGQDLVDHPDSVFCRHARLDYKKATKNVKQGRLA